MEDGVKDLQINDLQYCNFASTTSVNVERSFSRYNNVLENDRRSFILENIKKKFNRSMSMIKFLFR